MDTDIEMMTKNGLVLHDKIINELKPTLQNYNMQRCIENKYTIKLMETNLVFLKYENKVELYVAGQIFNEIVRAVDYEEARKVALAKPNATVVSITAVF